MKVKEYDVSQGQYKSRSLAADILHRFYRSKTAMAASSF